MALTGNEILQVTGVTSTGLPSGQTLQTTTQAVADLFSTVPDNIITPVNTVGAATLTAISLISGFLARGGAQLSTPFTDTTDTANNIITAITGAAIGDSNEFSYQNLTNAVATLTGGSGVTVSTITTIPPNGWAQYLLTYTAASTVTLVGVAQGFFPHAGTFTSIGSAPVTVADANITTASQIVYTLKNVGGTISTYPVVKTITTGVGFTVSAGTADLSVYNYSILG